MPIWHSGADGGLCLREGEEQVLTPSGSEEILIVICCPATKGTRESLKQHYMSKHPEIYLLASLLP